MMKRVSGARICVCGMLLAIGLVALGLVSPALAREDMSVGQAGDPGDGDEADMSGGSSTSTLGGTSDATTVHGPQATPSAMLIPVLFNGVVVFFVVFAPMRANLRQ